MLIKKSRDGRFVIRNAAREDAGYMEEVQRICFPTLAHHELLTRVHYINHINVFPEGQFVVTEQNKIVACSGTLRIDFPSADHTFLEITDNLWITHTHQQHGSWLYQFDIGVLPDYRGLKLSTELYMVQQDLVKKLGMHGQITVGMTSGFKNYQDRYTISEYCDLLKNQELTDPTVTPQLRAGFQWVKPIYNYVDDPSAGHCGVLLVWPVDSVISG